MEGYFLVHRYISSEIHPKLKNLKWGTIFRVQRVSATQHEVVFKYRDKLERHCIPAKPFLTLINRVFPTDPVKGLTFERDKFKDTKAGTAIKWSKSTGEWLLKVQCGESVFTCVCQHDVEPGTKGKVHLLLLGEKSFIPNKV